MKSGKIFLIVIMMLTIALAGCTQTEQGDDAKITIGITQIVEHQSLDDARQGVIDALSDNGFVDGENIEIEFKNAQGNIENAEMIAKSFVDKDIVVPITTPSTQAMFNSIKDKPIVYSLVTDPVSAGLEGDNITGVSDMTPVKKQFELMLTLLPETKVVGIIYNSSEFNSEIQVKIAEEVAVELGLELEVIAVSDTNEINLALDKILGEIDVLYTHNDNMLATAYPLIVKKADEANIPILAVVDDFIKQGALATEGINNYQVGYQSGLMVAKILNGEDIDNIPFETLLETELIVNQAVADKYGVVIPDELLDRVIYR